MGKTFRIKGVLQTVLEDYGFKCVRHILADGSECLGAIEQHGGAIDMCSMLKKHDIDLRWQVEKPLGGKMVFSFPDVNYVPSMESCPSCGSLNPYSIDSPFGDFTDRRECKYCRYSPATAEDNKPTTVADYWISRWFRPHTESPEYSAKYARITAASKSFAKTIFEECPIGPDQDMALQFVRMARMAAQSAVSEYNG